MEKPTNPPLYDGSNVLPFKRRSKPIIREEPHHVTVCTLCQNDLFILLSNGGICCTECENLVGAEWKTKKD